MSEPVPIPHHLWRNPLTLVGGIISALATLFLLSFLFFDVISRNPSPYLGLFTYLIFPVCLVVGCTFMVIGLTIARARHRRTETLAPAHYYPRIDFANPRHRQAATVIGLGAAVTLPVIGLLSYRGYHYTESNEFCGRVCHEVMEPQFTTFQHSPHARVDCAECHIGDGATWYLKSKISGLRQVWAVATNSVPRPIPPAIRELRPATETCEQCHWPGKFHGNQLLTVDHYATDEASTQSQIRMLMKTGGSEPASAPPSGIHWHMAMGFSIDYVATDHDLQNIPWVRMVDHTSKKETIYRSDGLPVTAPPPEGTSRKIDCMDCHNRPAHAFLTPDRAVNQALTANPSLRELPFAKRELVNALTQPYKTRDEADAGIRNYLTSYYDPQLPDSDSKKAEQFKQLVTTGVDLYHRNFFPAMNASWKTYPDNIGHMTYSGCFRCHDDQHKDTSGKAISSECSVCHEFLVPGPPNETRATVQIGQFVHPLPLEGIHATLRCDQCHSVGVSPTATCEGCHNDVVAFRTGTHPQLQRFGIKAEPMAEQVGCDGCHNLNEPRSIAAIDALCMDCHEDEEEKYRGMLASWKQEVDQLLRESRGRMHPEDSEILRLLQEAGPLHNIDATRQILRGLKNAQSTASAP